MFYTTYSIEVNIVKYIHQLSAEEEGCVRSEVQSTILRAVGKLILTYFKNKMEMQGNITKSKTTV